MGANNTTTHMDYECSIINTPNQSNTLFNTLPKDLQWYQMFYLSNIDIQKYPTFHIYQDDPTFRKNYIQDRYYQRRIQSYNHNIKIDFFGLLQFSLALLL